MGVLLCYVFSIKLLKGYCRFKQSDYGVETPPNCRLKLFVRHLCDVRNPKVLFANKQNRTLIPSDSHTNKLRNHLYV